MSSSGILGTSLLSADERKRKRMISNRESAKRSRERKRQQMDDLTNQVAQLKFQNGQIEMQVNLWKQQWVAVESENHVLRAQLKFQNGQIEMQVNLWKQQWGAVESENHVLRAQLNELSKRLQCLNSLLGITKEREGITVDSGSEMPDLLLPPLQLPCPLK